MNNQTNKVPTFFRFEDLRIYHKALEYISWVGKVCNGMPVRCSNGFVAGFNHSARQIALNIAEGSARNKAQFVYHLKMSKSAIRECVVYTTVAFNEGLISAEDEDESRNQLMEMTKMLGALITSLQKSASAQEQYEDEPYPNKNW